MARWKMCARAVPLALAILVLGAGTALAGEVVVGMSTALSGPAQSLGQSMKLGVDACFAQANAAGGVNANTLRLLAYDDGYEPDRCAPNMRKLLDKDKVLAVLGNVGTPTAIVSVPIANEGKTLLFGAFSGAGVLRKSPPDRYVINYRASYAQETAEMVTGFLSVGIKPEKIAFFTQNDGYGDAGHQGAVEALKAAGFAGAESLIHGRYTRNTENVEDALVTVVSAEPRAVIMVGTYKPCAKFIRLAREFLPDTLFANVSFVGSIPLLKELGRDGEGVIVTQVVPPLDADLAGVAEYRRELAAHFPGEKPDFVSLEGYLAAKIFLAGLAQAGKSPTRESIVDALENLRGLDIGIGANVSFGPDRHQASDRVWPTVIRGGSFVSLDWASLKAGM